MAAEIVTTVERCPGDDKFTIWIWSAAGHDLGTRTVAGRVDQAIDVAREITDLVPMCDHVTITDKNDGLVAAYSRASLPGRAA